MNSISIQAISTHDENNHYVNDVKLNVIGGNSISRTQLHMYLC